MIQKLFQQVPHEKIQMTSFQKGQIFFGKITKLFPNQLAEITVGQQKMIAMLETPLAENSRYWFQVHANDKKLYLKVFTVKQSPNSEKRANHLDDILLKLSLPQSPENVTLVRFFMREQLPLTKDILLLAANWLNEIGDITNGLKTIKQVVLQSLPFTQSVLSAIYEMQNAEPIEVLSARLMTLLSTDTLTPKGQQLKSLLAKLTTPTLQMVGNSGMVATLEKWLFGTKAEQKAAYHVLQSIGVFCQSEHEQMILVNMFENMMGRSENKHSQEIMKQQLPILRALLAYLQATLSEESDSLRQLKTHLNQVLSSHVTFEQKDIQGSDKINMRQLLTNILPFLNNNEDVARLMKLMLQEIWMSQKRRNDTSNRTKGTEGFGKTLQSLTGGFHVMESNRLMANLLLRALSNQEGTVIERQQHRMLQLIGQQVADMLPTWESGADTHRTMKEIIRSLGLHFEHELSRLDFTDRQQVERVQQSLKPLLLHYLQQHPEGSGQKEAEQLLHRLTGMQLLSQETGPLQQVVMQLPLRLRNKTVELTMQWSGRKTETGQIDPYFCRVLFYLQLEHLEDTVIDMRVQNRVMNITVMNDTTHLVEIATPFIHLLKTNLATLNYQVSSVSFHRFTNEQQQNDQALPLVAVRPYTGVDLRI